LVIQRKGRAHNKEEAYIILDCSQFKLMPAEIREIVEDWDKIQRMLRVHGKGAYASSCVAEVA
jgi:hypothetical protein